MSTNLARYLIFFIAVIVIVAACANNSATTQKNSIQEMQIVQNDDDDTTAATIAAKNSLVTINCGTILSASMVESLCDETGVVERISSVERKGVNCSRLYGIGKNAWGDELVFIVTVLKDAAAAASGIARMKKDNATNELETIGNIGDEAFTLAFKDPLTKRENRQLIFRKNGFLVELKTNESRSAKTPCPCYKMEKLKKLAAGIAEKL